MIDMKLYMREYREKIKKYGKEERILLTYEQKRENNIKSCREYYYKNRDAILKSNKIKYKENTKTMFEIDNSFIQEYRNNNPQLKYYYKNRNKILQKLKTKRDNAYNSKNNKN